LARVLRQAGMPARYVIVDRETPLLLPPDLRDGVPADHLLHFIIDAVAELDLRAARVNERGRGSEQYPPAMMLGLLGYRYATGVTILAAVGRQRLSLSHSKIPREYLCPSVSLQNGAAILASSSARAKPNTLLARKRQLPWARQASLQAAIGTSRRPTQGFAGSTSSTARLISATATVGSAVLIG